MLISAFVSISTKRTGALEMTRPEIFFILSGCMAAAAFASSLRVIDSNVEGDGISPSADARTIDASHFEYANRRRRYLGLSNRFKINKRYQECIAPGEVQGHCKHIRFCPMDVLAVAKASIDYMCIIEKTHVGVCCPDDVVLSGLTGSRLVLDLPAGGTDYSSKEAKDDETQFKGCGIAERGRWPWMAALFRPRDGARQFCGGALITDQHILTAAHCIYGTKRSDYRIRLGEYDFAKPDETRSMDFSATMVDIHEDYNPTTYENDIAVIKLDRASAFNSYVWPICLPPANRSFENEMVSVAGWGQQYLSGPISDVLKQVEIPVWEHEKCVEAFAQRVLDNNLCAAARNGGKDACLGDSGGPLSYRLPNGRYVCIGVVSWGIGCGNKGQPGIYVKVNSFLPWILRHTIL